MIGLAVCVCTGIDDTGLDFTALRSTDLSKGIVIQLSSVPGVGHDVVCDFIGDDIFLSDCFLLIAPWPF